MVVNLIQEIRSSNTRYKTQRPFDEITKHTVRKISNTRLIDFCSHQRKHCVGTHLRKITQQDQRELCGFENAENAVPVELLENGAQRG